MWSRMGWFPCPVSSYSYLVRCRRVRALKGAPKCSMADSASWIALGSVLLSFYQVNVIIGGL